MPPLICSVDKGFALGPLSFTFNPFIFRLKTYPLALSCSILHLNNRRAAVCVRLYGGGLAAHLLAQADWWSHKSESCCGLSTFMAAVKTHSSFCWAAGSAVISDHCYVKRNKSLVSWIPNTVERLLRNAGLKQIRPMPYVVISHQAMLKRGCFDGVATR